MDKVVMLSTDLSSANGVVMDDSIHTIEHAVEEFRDEKAKILRANE
jgi:hypothetical protein